MERDLKVVTTREMIKASLIEFYERDIDWDKFETYDYDNISFDEFALKEDELYSRNLKDIISEMIEGRTPNVVWFDNPEVIQVFVDKEEIKIPTNIVEKQFRKYLKEKGFNNKNYILKQSKVTNFWEIRLIGTKYKEFNIVMSRKYIFTLFAEIIGCLRNEDE